MTCDAGGLRAAVAELASVNGWCAERVVVSTLEQTQSTMIRALVTDSDIATATKYS